MANIQKERDGIDWVKNMTMMMKMKYFLKVNIKMEKNLKIYMNNTK